MIFIFRKNMQILPNPGFDLYANKRKKVTPKKQVGLFFVVMNSRNLLRTTFFGRTLRGKPLFCRTICSPTVEGLSNLTFTIVTYKYCLAFSCYRVIKIVLHVLLSGKNTHSQTKPHHHWPFATNGGIGLKFQESVKTHKE